MSNPIANFFQNLGDPQARKDILRNLLKAEEGEPTPPARGLRGFANTLKDEAYKLGSQANLDVVEQPEYVSSIIGTESGGNWSARNNERGAGGKPGHFGRSQFGQARFEEAKAAGAVPPGMTIEQFGSDTPEGRAAQLRAEQWHYSDLENQLGDLVGTVVNGQPLDMGALVAMGHLGGATGARRFVESGGRYNPSDSFGTSLADYAMSHGGKSGATPAGNQLSYGAEIDAADPMSDEYLGRNSGQRSMGMDQNYFETLKEKYGERQAMEVLNLTGSPVAAQPYDDAILRMLSEEAPPENAAQQQAAVLADGGLSLSNPTGLSMGIPDPRDTSGVTVSSGGGAGAPPPEPAPPVSSDEPKVTVTDKIMNAIYGTSVDDMSADERADRRRAVGIALTQGFQMLSRGTPMDVQGIVQQRMELQQARRASEELKMNAQGISDMLIASGLPELAQLPFAGESGSQAAMQALVTQATRDRGVDAPFDIPPSARATMAQTMADMGQGHLAEMFMTMPAGEAFEELYSTALGMGPDTTKGGAAPYTPEQRAAFAGQFRSAGNTFVADAIDQGLDDATISDLIKAQGEVAPAVQQAGQVAAAQAGVETATDTRSAEQIAAAYDEAGMTAEADIMRASGSAEAGKLAVEQYRADQKVLEEEAAIKTRGEAVAKLVPADHPNADELREIARNAKTSEDLNQVYSEIAGRTREEQLFKLAQKDPNFAPFLTDVLRDTAGADKRRSFSERKVIAEIDVVAEAMANSRLSQSRAAVNTDTIRQIIANPDFNPGKLQGTFLVPLQKWMNSIAGDAAPQLASGMDLTASRIFETLQAETFVAASEGLKGAISDKETAAFMLTATNIQDDKVSALAQLQYRDRISEIQQAEYQAMLDWAAEAEEKGTLGNRREMLEYVNKKVGDMKVFEQVNAEDVDDWLASANLAVGEVFEVVNPDGSSFLVPYGVELN